MINSISLKGFKSHRDTVIEFSEGVNSLTGETGSGKSTILKALTWVRKNRPTGDSVHNKRLKDKETSVTVLSNESSIKRFRDKTGNGYIVDGETYTAIGSSVPDVVSNILGMADVSVQEQFVPHFLINESTGKIGEYINEVTGVGDIDGVVKLLSKKKRASEVAAEVFSDELAKSTKHLEALNSIDIKSVEDSLQACEELQEGIASLTTHIDTLPQLIAQAESLHASVDKYKAIRFEYISEALVSCSDRLSDSYDSIPLLLSYITEASNCRGILDGCQLLSPDDIKLLDDCKSSLIDDSTIVSLANQIKTISRLKQEQEGIMLSVSTIDEELSDIMGNMDVCPVCETVLKGSPDGAIV